jgi:hypothetical protein
MGAPNRFGGHHAFSNSSLRFLLQRLLNQLNARLWPLINMLGQGSRRGSAKRYELIRSKYKKMDVTEVDAFSVINIAVNTHRAGDRSLIAK